jgi:hypothetical protein
MGIHPKVVQTVIVWMGKKIGIELKLGGFKFSESFLPTDVSISTNLHHYIV